MKVRICWENPELEKTLRRLTHCVCEGADTLRFMATSLHKLAEDVNLIRLKYYGPLTSEVEGINVTQTGENMASKFKVVALKKSGLAQARTATKQATPKLGSTFAITDGGQGVFTTMGLDSETPPQPVDISGLGRCVGVGRRDVGSHGE